ncbi:MAG: hypothetical protein V1725_04520 [archaeon]
MNVLKYMILALFALGTFAALTHVGIATPSDCGNEGFNCECQNFYNDAQYQAIEKWSYDSSEGDYVVDEANPTYDYFDIDVTGGLNAANWTSTPDVTSVLVKAGNERIEYAGSASGEVSSRKDISHITFCNHNNGNNGGGNGGGNGVPEFSPIAIGAAIVITTGGLVILRKK